MTTEAQHLRRAETARRLANASTDAELGRTLRTYAEECDAAALAARTPPPPKR